MNIPFDILGHIFSHYAEAETITYPLETLLLVSRLWSDAALGHRALWSHLKVHIVSWGGISSVKIWKTRLPLRLKRCGDTLPLHIELRHFPSRPVDIVQGNEYWELLNRLERRKDYPERGNTDPRAPCACTREMHVCVDEFLLLLAGRGGELCKRWSTLYLELHRPSDYNVVYEQLDHFVHHPMPMLTSATILGVVEGIKPGSFPIRRYCGS
jgi:F-box-like